MQFMKGLLYTLAYKSWRIRHNCTDNLVTAVYGDVDLLNRIETVMEGNKQEGGGVAVKALLDYPLLLSKVGGNILRI